MALEKKVRDAEVHQRFKHQEIGGSIFDEKDVQANGLCGTEIRSSQINSTKMLQSPSIYDRGTGIHRYNKAEVCYLCRMLPVSMFLFRLKNFQFGFRLHRRHQHIC